MGDVQYAKGLEGVIAAESKICKIDGEQGKLNYLGYSIEDLTQHCNYEEVTYLLLYGDLPTQEQFENFQTRMRKARFLQPAIVKMIQEFPRENHPMELLQSVIAYLSGYVEHKIEHSATCNCRQTLHQISQLATVIAAYHRIKHGKQYVEPRTDLSHGANFLYMLHGEEPDALEGEIMDKCLILHAEHSFNASTFTARVVASTLSTCYCSISAAIGALFGSLHGGANEKVVAMVEEIGSKENVRPWIDKALAEKRKVMGMGHRVYKAPDPRALIIEGFLQQLSEKNNDFSSYEILKEIEKVFREKMEEKGKPIYPNVDFFSGSVYRQLGIPPELFTPIFAMSRVSGWLSHILEQRSDNRLFRPRALYQGSEGRTFVPMAQR
ncbi:citrate synthase [candidate division KSB3 bacterium]|uniref:Citrate synthase n=1 Tax=candidate division KSB3 bacterium TaxID=2044937 RepID=A0A9D5Q624_9BACT|nr:citrate synthase [candidate division KSB3 bacterium]MBD3325409.1 citrate synthase [candidate division KSB3 bacterium]